MNHILLKKDNGSNLLEKKNEAAKPQTWQIYKRMLEENDILDIQYMGK